MPQKLEDILNSHGVDFRQGGRFEIMTHCPLCGDADQSEHLAVSTRKRGWRCLRNPRQHRGRSYVRLLTLLLRCSEERAKELLGVEAGPVLPDDSDLSQQWRKQLGLDPDPPASKRVLSFPSEFRPLRNGSPRAGGFWDYLLDRGCTERQAVWAAKTYNFHYALSGRYAYRLIVPIYDRFGKLTNWTARAIDPDAEVRYMTLGSDFAVCPPTESLLGMDLFWRAEKANCLVVCEGPFDAIAVSTLGHSRGVWGTCLFGLELSEAQADLLTELSDIFSRMYLALDAAASARTLVMSSWLPKRCRPIAIPPGFKDPGELIKKEEGEAFVLSLAA